MTLHPRKRSHPAGLPSAPFDPRTGAYLPLGNTSPFWELTILEAGHDVLLCEDRDLRPQLVLKPWSLRRSTFNGQTFEGKLYTSTALDQRTVDGAAENVDKPYFVGEQVMAYRRRDDVGSVAEGVVGVAELTGVGAGTYRVELEDMNTAGRRWSGAAAGSVVRVTITTPVALSGTYLPWEATEGSALGMWAIGDPTKVFLLADGWWQADVYMATNSGYAGGNVTNGVAFQGLLLSLQHMSGVTIVREVFNSHFGPDVALSHRFKVTSGDFFRSKAYSTVGGINAAAGTTMVVSKV